MIKLFLILLCAVSTPVFAEWTKSTFEDEMSGKPWVAQSVTSTNSLRFEFPYRGDNFATLTVRQHAVRGLDVLFEIEQGQIIDDAILIKFDDDQPARFSYNRAADGSSNVVFLRDKRKFLDRAKAANRIFVQFTAFQNGSPVARFSTPGGLQLQPVARQQEAVAPKAVAKPAQRAARAETAPAENFAAAPAAAPPTPAAPPVRSVTTGAYAARVAAAVRPNVVFPDADLVTGNPGAEFQIRMAADGTIVGEPVLTKSSGVPNWDEAALRGLKRTEKLPRDVDGTVPPLVTVTLHPKR